MHSERVIFPEELFKANVFARKVKKSLMCGLHSCASTDFIRAKIRTKKISSWMPGDDMTGTGVAYSTAKSGCKSELPVTFYSDLEDATSHRKTAQFGI